MNKRGAWVALLALVTALANPAPVRAMHPLDKVQALLQSPAVTVDEDTAWRYRILALLAPDRLPVSLQGEGTTRMATLVRAELVDAYPTLGDANKALLAELGWGLRPGPGGRGASTRLSYANGQTVDITSSVGTVRIHYTLDTQDPHATNQNYLDTLVSVVNTALQTEVLTLGYPMPPSDGDGIYDVYLEDQDNIYGYVQPEGGLTDNPNTTQVENSARTSHMVMENDMAEAVFKSTTQEALELNVKVTFAHEFFHAIQFGLAASFSDQTSWLLESTAVWMEITVYPGNNATYNEYSLDWMRYPDAGLIGTDGSLGITGTDPPYHQYGSFIFWAFFEDHASTFRDQLKNYLFRAGANVDGTMVAEIDLMLQNDGSLTRDQLMSNFTIANAALAAPGQGGQALVPYTHRDANLLPSIGSPKNDQDLGSINLGVDRIITYTGGTVTHNSQTDGNGRLGKLGADYLWVDGSTPAVVTLNATQGTLVLAAIQGEGSAAKVTLGCGTPPTLAIGVSSKVLLRIANLSTTTDGAYTLTLQPNTSPPAPSGVNCNVDRAAPAGGAFAYDVGDLSALLDVLQQGDSACHCVNNQCNFDGVTSSPEPNMADFDALATIVVNGADPGGVCQ